MSLFRARLTLDEQAFQGLLAAAFTIQEHNDRKRRDPDAAPNIAPKTAEPTSVKSGRTSVCMQCGATLQSEGAPCAACTMPKLRPGERLQRNWASMWLMSQEHALWPDRPTHPADRAQPKPIGNGYENSAQPPTAPLKSEAIHPLRITEDAHQDDVTSPNHNRPIPNGGIDERTASNGSVLESRLIADIRNDVGELRIEEYPSNESRAAHTNRRLASPSNGEHPLASLFVDELRGHNALSDLPRTDVERSDSLETYEEQPDGESLTKQAWGNPQLEKPEPQDLARAEQAQAADHDLVLAGDTFSESDEIEPANSLETAAPAIRDWRVKLRFHRADLYLGMAVLVALCALLWPSGAASHQPGLSSWDRMLIAMGIAEAPAPTVHYHGDPNLKVWVDTHTALYYCPGDELYGKSTDGHYTTQREAQADRFEPAERSACIVE